MHLLLRSFVASALLLSASGCNFIFNPDGDGVLRCDNADDCDAPLYDALSDQRGQSACGGGQGSSNFNETQTGKVCSVIDKEDVSCDPNGARGNFLAAAEAAQVVADAGTYKPCLSGQKGTLGCPPLSSGTCMQGTPRTYTALVAKGTDTPVAEERMICAPDGVADAVEPNDGLARWDVLDQHCRSYFCDEDFVCARGKGAAAYHCVRCDPKKPYGDGGCGTMILQGAVSTMYTADLGGSVCEATADTEKTDFGTPVAAPTCSDGKMNQDELGVDCGGVCITPCP